MASRKRLLLFCALGALGLLGLLSVLGRGCPSPGTPLEPALTIAPRYARRTRLVLVPGHSVFTGADFRAGADEHSWLLETYQRGQLATLVRHIREGVRIAAADNGALLLFSGGQTRPAAGPRSEAQSYWAVADAAGWWGHRKVRARSLTETFARDSFENVAFSLCRFRQLTGRFPENVTVVGFEFKRRRFEQLHRAAVGFPAERFTYVGIDPGGVDMAAAKTSERRTAAAFEADPRGCSQFLVRKRLSRDPFAQGALTYGACSAAVACAA